MRHPFPDWMIWVIYLLWLAAASLPVYSRILKHSGKQGLSFGGHFLALLASVVVGIVVVVVIMAVLALIAVVVDNVQRKFRRH